MKDYKEYYCRTKDGIKKIRKYEKRPQYENCHCIWFVDNDYGTLLNDEEFKKMNPSETLIGLIEYMDLLELEYPIKLYGSDTTIRLFNPVRCDGFTTFADGTNCIILNLDYIVDVKDLKIKSILTHEQFDAMKYEVK